MARIFFRTTREAAVKHGWFAALNVIGTITADAHYQLVLQRQTTNKRLRNIHQCILTSTTRMPPVKAALVVTYLQF